MARTVQPLNNKLIIQALDDDEKKRIEEEKNINLFSNKKFGKIIAISPDIDMRRETALIVGDIVFFDRNILIDSFFENGKEYYLINKNDILGKIN